MLCNDGKLRIHLGDYGIPLTFHITECCQECENELEPDDVVRAEVLRGGRVLCSAESDLEELEADEGWMELYFTPQEAESIGLGLYTFQVLLVREGEVRNTLLTTILEVVP